MNDDIKAFLLEHTYLTVYEIAIQLDKSPSTIRTWRKKLGLSQGNPFKSQPQGRQKKATPSVTDPEIWDNAEWFEEQYYKKKLGIITISKIINKSPRLVVLRFKKYGIESRQHNEAVRSCHPCSKASWLYYHYGTKEEYVQWAKENDLEPDKDGGKALSLKRCAEAAGVVPATIYNWLVRIKRDGCAINMRDPYEAVAGERNPFYGKKHTEETKEKLRKTSSAYIKSRAKKSVESTKEA